MSQKGINSVEVAMRLLNAFAAPEEEMSLKALASGAGMHPSKAHRYLVSLIRADYVEQSRSTGRYTLGAGAMSLGLAAMRKLNVARFGDDIITALRDETLQTITMVMLANAGPTIVRVSEANTPIIVSVRVGSVLPVLTSTNGQIFLAYATRQRIAPLIRTELGAARRIKSYQGPRTMQDVERLASQVQRRRMARTTQPIVPGVVAMSAPVFDHRDELACSLTLVASARNLDLSWDGKPAKALRLAAERFSARLGAAGRSDKETRGRP